MKYLKSYRKQSNLCNESISHLLKPKKEEDIKDLINNINDPYSKLYTIFSNGIEDFFEEKEIINIFNQLDSYGKTALLLDSEGDDDLILPDYLIKKLYK